MAHCPSLCLHLLIRTWAENPCPSSPGKPRCPRTAEFHSASHSAGLPAQWLRKTRGWATAEPWRVVWSPYPQDKQRERTSNQSPAALCRVGGGDLPREACLLLGGDRAGSSRPEEADKGRLGPQHLHVYLRSGSLHGRAPGFTLWIPGPDSSSCLCLSLSLAMCFSNCVSTCATLQVIHPSQPHTQGEGRAGQDQARMC